MESVINQLGLQANGQILMLVPNHYGFIQPRGTKEEIFFHCSNWIAGSPGPVLGQFVTFEVGLPTRLGKPNQALKVRPIETTETPSSVEVSRG